MTSFVAMMMEPETAENTAAAKDNAEDAVGGLMAKLLDWWETAVAMLPNLVVAIVVVVAAFWLARISRKWVHRGLDRTDTAVPLKDLAASLVRLAIVAGGVMLALSALTLDRAVAAALASVGVVGLALGFAFQDAAANLMAGVIMAVKRPFSVGEVIETAGYVGTVQEIGLRATTLKKFTGEIVMIPNNKVFTESLVNNTAAGNRRIDIAVGVSYDDDLEEAERVAREAVEAIADSLEDPAVAVVFTAFGGSSIDFEVRFWVPYADDLASYLRGQTAAIKAIKKAFDDHGITIPFPIRTVDFGIEGGQRLDQALTPIVEMLTQNRKAS